MKKLFNETTAALLSLVVLVGCATIAALTPAQITTIGTVITQIADQGAVYAIQQDKNNATYFKLAVPVLDNFANGTDLSPTALQAALAKVTSTNQWVNLAITAAVTAYDVSYSRYISDQLTNAPAAKVWILDVETGFQQALAQTGTALKLAKLSTTPPDFIVKGKVDKAVIKAKIQAVVKR
jgi:hypothetical protein